MHFDWPAYALLLISSLLIPEWKLDPSLNQLQTTASSMADVTLTMVQMVQTCAIWSMVNLYCS